MERYAPTLKDLAPRDFVSRCMDQEIKEGRGCGPNKDYVVLDMTHLGAETIMKRLPIGVRDRPQLRQRRHHARSRFRWCRPSTTRWAASRPTSTARSSCRRTASRTHVVNGLYAVGECACVSVHGANRLGTNSLLDLLVFGRAAGNHIVESALKHEDAQAAAGRCRRLHAGAPGAARCKHRRASTRRTSPTTSARACSSTPACSARRRRWTRAWRRSPRCASASTPSALADKSKVFNTARSRGAGGREPDRVRAGHDRLGRGSQGMPRRAHRERLRAPRRRRRVSARPQRSRVDEAHAVVPRRQPARSTSRCKLKPLTVESVPPKVRTF